MDVPGVFFSSFNVYNIPVVPYVQDVLFVLRLSELDSYYIHSLSKNSPYIENVGLVVAAIASEVLDMKPYHEAAARKIIAHAIIKHCHKKMCCLFRNDFMEAYIEAEYALPATRNLSRNELEQICVCPSHQRRQTSERMDADSADFNDEWEDDD